MSDDMAGSVRGSAMQYFATAPLGGQVTMPRIHINFIEPLETALMFEFWTDPADVKWFWVVSFDETDVTLERIPPPNPARTQ